MGCQEECPPPLPFQLPYSDFPECCAPTQLVDSPGDCSEHCPSYAPYQYEYRGGHETKQISPDFGQILTFQGTQTKHRCYCRRPNSMARDEARFERTSVPQDLDAAYEILKDHVDRRALELAAIATPHYAPALGKQVPFFERSHWEDILRKYKHPGTGASLDADTRAKLLAKLDTAPSWFSAWHAVLVVAAVALVAAFVLFSRRGRRRRSGRRAPRWMMQADREAEELMRSPELAAQRLRELEQYA